MSKLFETFGSERRLNIPVPSVYGPTVDENPLAEMIERATTDA